MDMNQELKCPVCGEKMTPIMFLEEEWSPDGHYRTGRVRRACSHLEGEYCGNKECVDGDFLAGVWASKKDDI